MANTLWTHGEGRGFETASCESAVFKAGCHAQNISSANSRRVRPLMLADERQRSGSMHRVIFPAAPRRTRPGEASEDAYDRNICPKPVQQRRCLRQARPESG